MSGLSPQTANGRLQVLINSGTVIINGTQTTYDDTWLPLLANSLNYVYVDPGTFELTVSPGPFPTNAYPIAIVQTNAVEVLSINDVRVNASINTISPNPSTTPYVMYVSPDGDDDNDGLTWQTAKATVFNACISLPEGSSPNQCGNGVVYFIEGSLANPVSGAGLWIMGSNDPNYGNPPSGWLLQPAGSLSIIGLPTTNHGPNAHLGRAWLQGGSGADANHPGVWLSSTEFAGRFANINIQYPGRAWVIGVDSNGDITPSASGCTGLTFDNCTGSINGVSGNGPCWTIGGESYWLLFNNCGGAGCIGTGSHIWSDDSAQAFLIDGRGSSGGQIINFKGVTNLSQGGIKVYAGSNGIGFICVDDATEEGSFDGTNPVAPVLWLADNGISAERLLTCRANCLQIADGGSNPMPAVQNDCNAQVFVTNAFGNLINTKGPCINLADYANEYQNLTVSPAQYGQAGFFGAWGNNTQYRVFGQQDDVRRNYAVYNRFQNLATSLPSNWTSSGGSIATGITAPDGTTNAGQVSNSESYNAGAYFANSSLGFSVGDWLIIGCWVRSESGNGMTQFPIGLFLNTSGYEINGTNTIQGGSFIAGDGEWQYCIGLGQITAIGSGGCYYSFQGLTDSTHVLQYYLPTCLYIPTGTVSTNEAYLIAGSLVSSRSDAPQKSFSLAPSVPLYADGVMMPKITTTVSAPGADVGFFRWEAGTNSGTLKLVAYAGTSATGVTIVDNVGSGN